MLKMYKYLLLGKVKQLSFSKRSECTDLVRTYLFPGDEYVANNRRRLRKCEFKELLPVVITTGVNNFIVFRNLSNIHMLVVCCAI